MVHTHTGQLQYKPQKIVCHPKDTLYTFYFFGGGAGILTIAAILSASGHRTLSDMQCPMYFTSGIRNHIFLTLNFRFFCCSCVSNAWIFQSWSRMASSSVFSTLNKSVLSTMDIMPLKPSSAQCWHSWYLSVHCSAQTLDIANDIYQMESKMWDSCLACLIWFARISSTCLTPKIL